MSKIDNYLASGWEVIEETESQWILVKNTASGVVHLLLALFFWWLFFIPNIIYHSTNKKKIAVAKK